MADSVNNPGAIVSTNGPTRIKIPLYVQILKISSVACVLGAILSSTYFSIDMHPDNQYLGVMGYDDNTYTLYEKTKQQHDTAIQQKRALEREEADLDEKIETKDYSENTIQIKSIKEKQITWFDSFDKDGNFKMGLFDLPNHLGDYVNSGQLDEELGVSASQFTQENSVTISNITVNRTNVNFSFEATNLYGKVFNLTNEFIALINGIETLEGVSISSFTRTENDEGYDSMSFNVNASIQTQETEDPFDNNEQHQKFLDWVEAEARKKQPITTSNTTTPASASTPIIPNTPVIPNLRNLIPRN